MSGLTPTAADSCGKPLIVSYIASHCFPSCRVQGVQQKANSLAGRMRSDLISVVEARMAPTPSEEGLKTSTTLSRSTDSLDADSRSDALQLIQHCLHTVQSLQVVCVCILDVLFEAF